MYKNNLPTSTTTQQTSIKKVLPMEALSEGEVDALNEDYLSALVSNSEILFSL